MKVFKSIAVIFLCSPFFLEFVNAGDDVALDFDCEIRDGEIRTTLVNLSKYPVFVSHQYKVVEAFVYVESSAGERDYDELEDSGLREIHVQSMMPLFLRSTPFRLLPAVKKKYSGCNHIIYNIIKHKDIDYAKVKKVKIKVWCVPFGKIQKVTNTDDFFDQFKPVELVWTKPKKAKVPSGIEKNSNS